MEGAIVLQARLGSTRLPGKVLRAFYRDRSILEVIVGNLANNRYGLEIIVATTDQPTDDPICDACRNMSVPYFRGSEEDVLDRFIACADYYELKWLVRACADNPLIDAGLMDQLVAESLKTDCDYAGYTLREGTPAILTHFGFFTEYVRVDALRRVAQLTDDLRVRQHVTKHIYEQPEDFDLLWIETPPSIADGKSFRLTVDTEMDLENAASVYRATMERFGEIKYEDVCLIARSDPKLAEQMQLQIAKNSK